MNMLTPAEAYVAYAISYLDGPAVLEWAQRYAEAHSNIGSESALYEILWHDLQSKEQPDSLHHLLGRFAAEAHEGFDPNSPMSEVVAKDLFEARLREYLSGATNPWAVCRMVAPIEGRFDFPGWLGNMYNSCDWIEFSTSREECSHLEADIQKHLNGV